MNKFKICFALILLLVGCVSAGKTLPKRIFHFDKFGGLVSDNARSYQEVAIDYELTDKKGENIHIDKCLQVDSNLEKAILESEYLRYKILSIHCSALRLYIENGHKAKYSFFPEKLTETLLRKFPATVGPIVNKDYLEARSGKTLGEHESFLNIAVLSKSRAELMTQTDEITLDVLARADFNNDGFEDLLVRTIWQVRDAFGKGSNLFILEKKSATEPISLTWRYTKI